MANVKITINDNGPYRVEGEIELVHENGTPVKAKRVVYLCRCGASVNKPFCDGTHTKIGFAAAAEAVPESKDS